MPNKVTLTILGQPGSGKGSQAKILAKKFNLFHIELGVLIRRLIKKDKTAKLRYQKGIPQPDSLIEKLLEKEINQLKNQRLLIDPFPLTCEQINILQRLVDKFKLAKPLTIYLKTNRQEVLKRMMTRKDNRSDDNLETAKKRIKIYQKLLKPALERLKNKNQLLEIDGNPPIPEVTNEILERLEI